MLLLEAGRVVSTDRLTTAIWEESPPTTARGQIQICVSALRKAMLDIGLGRMITTRSPGYVIELPPRQLDLHLFEELVSSSRKAAQEGRLEDAIAELREALALWRGAPLEGIESPLVRAACVRLEELRGIATEEHTDLRLRMGGQDAQLVAELKDLVAASPLREHLRAQLMLALYHAGRQAEALAIYREARQMFIDELGIEPGPELRDLERAILIGHVDLEPQPAAEPNAPAQPAYVPARLLPPQVAEFTGNAALCHQLHRMIDDAAEATEGPPAMIAIYGRGGVGKTTLAVKLAHLTRARFPDGQLYARLNASTGTPMAPSRVLERFLRALGMPGSRIPDGLEERAETFRSLVTDRRVLILLDDVAEQQQILPLMPSGAPSTVLVTSRHRLAGVPSSQQLECQVLGASDAVELVARVVGSDRIYGEPSQALQLVELCDRLPLALRIAAGRLAARPYWTVAQIVERLSDESQRLDELSHAGQSVRANIAVSYDMLDEASRRLFRMLGMLEMSDFPEWICGPLLGERISAGDEAIGTLVEARLVEVERPADQPIRFRLHDLVRAFARERLVAEESTAARTAALHRVLGAWLYLAEEAHSREYGGDDTVLHSKAQRWPIPAALCDRLLTDPLDWYSAERSALVAMIRQAADAGADDFCWDLAISAVTLFETRSYFDDWRTTHEMALAAVRHTGNKPGEAAMLYSLGALAIAEYRLEDSRVLVMDAERLFHEQGAAHGRALALRNLAFVDRVQGRVAEAMRRYELARETLHEVGDLIGEAHVLSGMAHILVELEDLTAARDLLSQALAVTASHANRRMRAQLMYLMGEVSRVTNDFDKAVDCFHEALELVRQMADRIGEAYALYGIGLIELASGSTKEAEATLSTAARIARESGDPMILARTNLALADAHQAAGSAQHAIDYANEALRLFKDLNAVLWQGRTLYLLGQSYLALGLPSTAGAAWRDALDVVERIEGHSAQELSERLRKAAADL